jgi:hypothetical protein
MESNDRALALGRELIKIWEDQAAFNLLFRQPPSNDFEMAEQAHDFVTYTTSELHELLRTLPWKKHRNIPVAVNRGHMRDEVADVFKCIVSLFQIVGQTPETAFEAYWSKTAVVRQRYQEEWVKRLDRPCAVIDIDQVLCDYISGICDWLHRYSGEAVPGDRLQEIVSQRLYVNALTLGLPEEKWKKLKHEFRVSGGKRYLPVFADAKVFLQALMRRGLQIVLLTSRPVDRYPNIYTDTLLWLERNELPYDFIWWAHDKGERVLETGLREHVRLFADDDVRFIDQISKLGIPSYWVQRGVGDAREHTRQAPNVHPVQTLQHVVDHYDHTLREAETWPITPTPSIDLTAPTSGNLSPRLSRGDRTH